MGEVCCVEKRVWYNAKKTSSRQKTNNIDTKIQIAMSSLNGLMKPNTRIFLGIAMFIIAVIYITDKLMNNIDIRLFDWIAWVAMFTIGAISIIEGIKIKKNNH